MSSCMPATGSASICWIGSQERAAAPDRLLRQQRRAQDLRARLPEIAEIELAEVHVTVVHETGGAKDRESRVDRRFPGTDLLVFGHSHIPWDSTTPGGIRLLNPGSPTDRGASRTRPT